MVTKISKIIEAKNKIAKIQMDRVESARQKIEDVAADFKAEDLGATAKKVLGGLDKLNKHIEDKNFGLAEATIEASIKELRSTKKRIFNDAVKNLEESIVSDEEEKTDTEEEPLVPDEEDVTLEEEEEPKKSSKKSTKQKKAAFDNKSVTKKVIGRMAKAINKSNIQSYVGDVLSSGAVDEADFQGEDALVTTIVAALVGELWNKYGNKSGAMGEQVENIVKSVSL